MHTLPYPGVRSDPGTNKCIFWDNVTFSGNPWVSCAESIATPLLPYFSPLSAASGRGVRPAHGPLIYYTTAVTKTQAFFTLISDFSGEEIIFSKKSAIFAKEKRGNKISIINFHNWLHRAEKILQVILQDAPAAHLCPWRAGTSPPARGWKCLTCPAR